MQAESNQAGQYADSQSFCFKSGSNYYYKRGRGRSYLVEITIHKTGKLLEASSWFAYSSQMSDAQTEYSKSHTNLCSPK